jgi:glutamate synthase (NADPH/NADH) small chain
VAVVGAGPAGLSCAAELRRHGHAATIFEAADKAGGLNALGVADYKMDHDAAMAEIGWLHRELGLEVLFNQRVGQAVTMERLAGDFDAVFLGVGLAPVPPLGIPGEDLPGCRDVLDFIVELKTQAKEDLSLAGQRVVVIGGGNTAIDGVTQAARLGAQRVTLVYRRGREQMKAYDHEVELARLDGAELVFFARPVAVLGEQRVTGLRCQRTRLKGGKLEPVEGETFELAADLVLRATGQGRHGLLAEIDGLKLDRGVVVVDDHGRTSHEKIWAGGDCANGGKEVVNAVAEGRRAALSIHATLGGRDD